MNYHESKAGGSVTIQPSEVDDDPFEAFERSAGAETVQNPYPRFAELRERAAVHKVTLKPREAVIGGATKGGVNGGDAGAAAGQEPAAGYTVVRYQEAMQVLRDGETFSSSGYAESMGAMLGNSILNMDAPEHFRYRSLIQQAFNKRAMQRWEDDLVVRVVDEHIDRFVDDKKADLVKSFTFPFPVHVIAGLLGLPDADLPEFHREAVAMVNMGYDWSRALRASKWLREYFAELLTERRKNPANDMMSVLAGVESDGDKLTDEDIFGFLRLLLPAGAETTYRSTSNLLQGLLTHPDQLAAVTEDRSLIPQAVEEGLRWDGPLTAVARTATRDVEVDGVLIPAGSMVTVSLGAGNHDHGRWGPTAEDFDIFRESRAHLAFASGPHVCLGLQLARMETRVALNRLFDRLPNLRLDEQADPDSYRITGLAFRAPRALPVKFG